MMLVLLMSMIVNAYNVKDTTRPCLDRFCYMPQRKQHVFKYTAPQPKEFLYKPYADDPCLSKPCVLIAQTQVGQ